MKKYRVSLALKIPSNFEVEIKANTKRRALERALEKYQDGKFDEDAVNNIDWSNMELDIYENGRINDIGNGISIEEIK